MYAAYESTSLEVQSQMMDWVIARMRAERNSRLPKRISFWRPSQLLMGLGLMLSRLSLVAVMAVNIVGYR